MPSSALPLPYIFYLMRLKPGVLCPCMLQLVIWIAVHDANAWHQKLGTVDG